jgi:hypothetical protein
MAITLYASAASGIGTISLGQVSGDEACTASPSLHIGGKPPM